MSGQHSFPIPSTRYGPSGCSASAVKTEPSGSTATMLRGGALLLEVAADAGDRPPGPHRDHDRLDLAAVSLLPELRARRLVVRLGVRRVRVLVGLEAARDLLGEAVGHGVVALGRVRVDRGRRDHDLGAVGPEHRDLLLAHLVRHDEDAAVPAQRRRDREPGTGVAGRGLDDRPAGPQPAVALGGLDHRQADPILHGAAGVQVLELGEELAGNVAAEALEPDDRRLPDEVEDRRVLPAAHRPEAYRPASPIGATRSVGSRNGIRGRADCGRESLLARSGP